MPKILNKRTFLKKLSNLWYFLNFNSQLENKFNVEISGWKDRYIDYKNKFGFEKEFSIELWDMLSNDIEVDFLQHFSLSFLKHPVIRRTMFMDFAGPLQKQELEYLEQKIPPQKLKELLKESKIGHPTITKWKYFTSHNSIHHLFHLERFKEETGKNIESVETLIEWGGGYGNIARIIKKINPNVTYVIIDLPIFSFIQATYLSSILGKEEVNLIDSEEGSILKNKINIIPLNRVIMEKLSIPQADLFLSTWALSESSAVSQEFVESKDYFGAKYLLIAHQEKSENVPNPENITNHLKNFQTVYHQKIPLLKNNYYLFCKRNDI